MEKKQNFNKPSAVDQQQDELFITAPLKQEVGANSDALDLDIDKTEQYICHFAAKLLFQSRITQELKKK